MFDKLDKLGEASLAFISLLLVNSVHGKNVISCGTFLLLLGLIELSHFGLALPMLVLKYKISILVSR